MIRLKKLCKEYQIDCLSWSSNRFLDRHYQAAKLFNADAVVKIPSDCPLIDPNVIDRVLEFYSSIIQINMIM